MKPLTRMAGYIEAADFLFAIPVMVMVVGVAALISIAVSVPAPTDPLIVEVESVNFCEKQEISGRSRCGVLVWTSRPEELRALKSFRLPDPEKTPDSGEQSAGETK